MDKSLHIFLILATCVFLSACDKEKFPEEDYFEDTPYYPVLKVSNEWNTPTLGADYDFDFIHSDAEVVIVSDDKTIKAVNSQDGSFLWSYEIPPYPSSLYLKYHYYEGNLIFMHYNYSSNVLPQITPGSITSINALTGNENYKIDYQSINPPLAKVINITPYEDNVLIFSNFDEGSEEDILNIYNLNLTTNQVTIIKENYKTLNHLDIRNPALSVEDGLFIFHTMEMENQEIETFLNVIDLENYSFKSILVENYPFSFSNVIHYNNDIAILVSSANDYIGHAVNINTGEKIWEGQTPEVMFSHLGSSYGFDRTSFPNLIHHNINNNHQIKHILKENISSFYYQLHPTKNILVDIIAEYSFETNFTSYYISLFDLNDGKLLIETYIVHPTGACYLGEEPDKIYIRSNSRIFQFSHPL